MLHDVPDDAATDRTYECLECGKLTRSETHPGNCDDCGGRYQDHAMSLE